MTLMNLILFFYFFMIQFKGVSPQTVYINHFSRIGQDTTLSCDRGAQQGPTCSRVNWFYNRDQSQARLEVLNGKVEVKSPKSSTLRLNTDCSLIVHNVTDEDSGRYSCGLSGEHYWYTYVFLSVLSVSPAPRIKTGQISLECTLQVYYTLSCEKGSFHWLNENGTVLSGDGITQNKCVSSLTVERQSEHRKYTCQYVLNNGVQISADYTPEVRERGNTGVSPERVYIDHFSRAGQNTTLSCDRGAQQGPTCSRVAWYYNIDQSQFRLEVWNGTVEEDSPRSSTLRLNTDCSLTVHNVTDEDSGRYSCGLSGEDYWYTYVFLSVLSVTPAPLNKTGQISLECTLQVFYTRSCQKGSFHWLNENRTVLSGAGITQNNCVSSLTVERQREHSKYTCQYVLNNRVQISADYTPEVREIKRGNTGSTDPKVYIGVGAGASLLVLLVVVVVFFKIRAQRNSAETTEDTEAQRTTENPQRTHSEMVEYKNFSPGSVSEDPTYQSLCPATRDPDQVYSPLHPQPQD